MTRILEVAGFARATVRDVHEPVYYGDGVEAASEWNGGFQGMRDAPRSPDTAAVERERLRRILEQRRRDEGRVVRLARLDRRRPLRGRRVVSGSGAG